MWVDKDYWEYWKYNNAFAGKSDQTLADLFQPATLGGLPSEICFVYSIPEQAFLRADYLLEPHNIGSTQPLIVTFTTNPDWLAITPTSGTTPQLFTLTTYDVDRLTTATYSGTLSVTATTIDLLPVANSPQTIAVSLQVVDTPFEHLHLPMILK